MRVCGWVCVCGWVFDCVNVCVLGLSSPGLLHFFIRKEKPLSKVQVNSRKGVWVGGVGGSIFYLIFIAEFDHGECECVVCMYVCMFVCERGKIPVIIRNSVDNRKPDEIRKFD